MECNDFDELNLKLQGLFQEKDYASALELATHHIGRFPENRPMLDYWRMVLSARLENFTGTLAIFKELLDGSSWFGENILRNSPSFQPLQGLPEFEQLVSLSLELQKQEANRLFPLLTIRPEGKCQAGGPSCPLLLALHSNSGTVQTSIDFWKPAASSGWLVAAPQSSQAIWKGAYIWDDRQVSEREVKKHYTNLCKQYAIDVQHTVLAGHSMGGEIAIWLALSHIIPVSGFLAIGPGGPFMDNPEEWQLLLKENRATGVRGYIIIGEEDQSIPQDNIPQLVQMFNKNSIPCKLEIIPGASHDYIPEYAPAILRALNALTS